MRGTERTEALLVHLEVVLRRLERENRDPFRSCCACLQDVETVGHLPSCHLAGALKAIEAWWSVDQ